MTATHSTMRNGRGNTVSATSQDYAETMVETWHVRITTVLKKDGGYTVIISDRDTGVVIRTINGQYPEA